MPTAGNITAVLTLNSSGFQSGLTKAITELDKFKSSATGVRALNDALTQMESTLQTLSGVTKSNLNTFSKLSTAINKMANGLKILQSSSLDVDQAVNTMNSIFNAFQGALNGTEIKVKGVSTVIKEMANSERQSASATNQVAVATQQYDKALELALPPTRNLITGTRELANAQNQLQAEERETSGAVNQATNSMNRQATASKGLGKAMSSLRMMTSMVGSMIAYNFAHNLAVATTETINAKSEMNGYFQMLGYTKGQVADFNAELDKTVQLFPRLNKYALGETISSIGVEFELTTEEMKKAMPVVSMITSEYLRAGRNVNEASLAVKDILQGEFQRLSRETGVKGDQLKEAGWSGDKNDVMGLLEALDKVGRSRNWDTFVTKANSLNDAVLILQNRFSEWSADMVEVVQPAIVTAFNGMMGIAEGFATVFGGVWEWLNSGSWESTAVNIGLLGGALLTVSQALVMYRGQMGLVQASQLGLSKSIATLIFGLKGEEIAHIGVANSIKAKILGVQAEVVAERGVTSAIREKLLSLKLDSIEQRINGAVTKENSVAKELNALYTKLQKAEEEGLITAKAKESIEEELNTASKELNTIATLEQEGANTGLIASLYALGTGEALATAETGALATAMGVLNGVFMLSPIGWLTGLVLGLAGAFYVLTGGLSDTWSQMQTFNDNVEKGNDALEPYWKNVDQTWQELEKAKEEHGENSEEVKNLSEKLRTAKDSFDGFRESLQKGVKISQELNDELEQLEPHMDAITRSNYGSLGKDKKEVDEAVEVMNAMGYGYDESYIALQKLVRMEGKFSDSQKEAIPILTEHGRNLEENAKNVGDYNKKMHDYMDHSTNANTAEDWWTWMWESIWAGSAKQEADWTVVQARFENFFRDLPDNLRKWIDDATSGKVLSDTGAKLFDDVGKWFSNGFKSLSDSLSNWWNNEVPKSLGDSWTDLQEMWNNNIAKPIGEMVGNFISDPLGSLGIDLGGFDFIGKLFEGFFNNDGGGTTGGFMKKIDISALLQGLFSLGDGIDFTWAWEWVNTNLISPISQALLTFISDPVSFIGNMGFSINGLLDALLGTDVFTNIWTWTYTNIVSPIGNAIWNGIQQIPLLGSILSLLGLLSDENIGASQKGRAIANWIGNGITAMISQIPIVSDILRMLGLIPQTEPDANSKGRGVGDNIKQGLKNGINGIADSVRTEMDNVITAISNKFGEAYSTANKIGSQILDGIKDALDMHSPSIISRELIANEFGVYIPNAIRDSGSTAYNTAYEYGQSIKDGISATTFNTTGFDSAVGVYQDDAQIVADSSQYMGVTTSTAFNDMTLAVNQTTSTMSGNVATTYNSMQQKQQTSLNSMKTQNLQAYNEMYLKSNQSLIQMRDSTTNVTHQMINAWDHMKNQIIASANRLKTDSTAHFTQLSSTIGSFYRKIQNPSNWGAGTGGTPTRSARHPTQGKSIARMMTRTATHHGAGASPYTNGTGRTMTLRALKNLICPSGDCSIFDGYDLNQKVNIDEFLSGIDGEHGFGWGDWSGKHYNHIKTTSDKWSMKSPTINLAGGIPTNADYKVGDFENGTPKISFSAFQSMAESIFSVIPYKFYYDSNWKGSWLGALQAGACNCSDGAEALIAFAEACGFSGYKQHTTTKGGIGHFYAVINGKAMDTTHFQNSGSWTPLGGAGIPTRSATPSAGVYPQGNKTVNVNVEISGTVYGVDDLDSKIQESVKQGLREEFNDPYTVAI